ncbi:MAG: 6-phosphogluconolactonase, partial [Microcoleus sp.]
ERAGFQPKLMHIIPTLNDSDIAETTRLFAAHFEEAYAEADYCLGLFGVGADGHTAGILPHSPAVGATSTATYYQSDPYSRITLTVESLLRLDEAVVFAFGENKWPIVHQLETQELALVEQPAQLVKRIMKITLVTDYKGEIA